MARPLLDVTEVLIDPMFQDTEIQVTRVTETIDNNGVAQHVETTTQFAGVVVQNSGDQLKRLEDGSRHGDSISIYTQTDLVDGKEGRTADIVTWQARRYTVMNVLDWSTYGRGFKHAICDLLDVTPP